jgi:hypothetical protein
MDVVSIHNRVSTVPVRFYTMVCVVKEVKLMKYIFNIKNSFSFQTGQTGHTMSFSYPYYLCVIIEINTTGTNVCSYSMHSVNFRN